MSWWISLEDETGNYVDVARHEEGGTYALGGVTDATVNVTYNYGRHFAFRDELHGKTGRDTIPALRAAVERLGTERDPDDYWLPTEGNAGYACSILLAWAEQYPDAIWRVN